jgi:transposase-like protein
MSTVTRKRFSSDFKAQAVEMVRLGKGVPEVAEELGIGTGILYRWTQSQRQPVQLGSADLRAGGEKGEADELRRLRPFEPNTFVDITAEWPASMEWLGRLIAFMNKKEYDATTLDSSRTAKESLARYRGATCGVKYAEAVWAMTAAPVEIL